MTDLPETIQTAAAEAGAKLLDRAGTAAFLQSHDNYLILCHAHPDGDTLGSGIALREMLRLLGKTAYTVCASQIPPRLACITEERETLLLEQLPDGFLWDTVISVDIAAVSLMGAYAVPFGDPGHIDLAIDHHGTHRVFAKEVLVDPEMAACAEIIFDLGVLLFGWSEENPAPPVIAAALYAGINTDSGSFKYAAVTPQTHHRAAVLLSSKIAHARLTARIYGSRPMQEVMAAKAAYADLRFFCGGQISLVTFTMDTMKTYKLRDEDIEDIVNMIRGIRGVRIAIHLKPRGEGVYKLSLRSEIGVDVSKVCAVFGGGGHPCAAGCTITAETPETAEALILAAAEQALTKTAENR